MGTRRLALIGAIFAALTLGLERRTLADRPADSLLDLVPADAGIILTIEDLRGQSQSFLDSRLASELRQLPAFQAWLASDAYRRFEHACRDIKLTLGVTPEQIRDDFLGDAVVLALRLAPGERPDNARGLLLAQVRDRVLLERVIDRLNAVQKSEKELVTVERHERDGTTYNVRRFQAGSKPPEAYAFLGKSTFAWSNSEELIRGAIDRHKDDALPGLGASAGVHNVRDALPEDAVASLFVDPGFLMRVLEIKPPDAEADPGGAFLYRYLSAIRYAGASLVVRDGLFLHVHQQIDPSKLDEPLKQWALGGPDEIGPLLQRVPTSAPILAHASIKRRRWRTSSSR